MTLFKPMLAAPVDLEKLRFPTLASPKLDGIRATVLDGVVLSRKLKPIPNKFVQEKFKTLEGFDGELIFGDPTAKDAFNKTTSAVMSQSSTDGADVAFHVFDHVLHPSLAYMSRHKYINKPKANMWQLVPQHLVGDMGCLLSLETKYLEQGYEGLILRHPNGVYKFGRSTANEQLLLKLKRFVDAEYEVVGFEERMHNGNEPTVDELGRTKRSSHQANKTGRGDLGALVLRYSDTTTFTCGTGFDDALRQRIWANQSAYLGRFAKVKYFAIGMKDLPRFPVFLGFRDPKDM